jgi:hypothetical protein
MFAMASEGYPRSDGEDGVQVFGMPVLLGGGFAADQIRVRSSPRSSVPFGAERFRHAREKRFRNGLMHQQRFRGIATERFWVLLSTTIDTASVRSAA